MKTKIKDIKEILPETLDYLVLSAKQAAKKSKKAFGQLEAAAQNTTDYDTIDESLKREVIGAFQYTFFHTALIGVATHNGQYYDKLKNDIQEKKGDAQIDIDYLQTMSNGQFMDLLSKSYSLLKK